MRRRLARRSKEARSNNIIGGCPPVNRLAEWWVVVSVRPAVITGRAALTLSIHFNYGFVRLEEEAKGRLLGGRGPRREDERRQGKLNRSVIHDGKRGSRLWRREKKLT